MNKGFTLIEMVIVVLFVGIILAIAVPNIDEASMRMEENESISCRHKYECIRCGEKM